ncbi:MAG: class I adenylate-forming enzyme family protein [Jatrophihabitans sp.]|uniref:class I adenylate-forming enzyme family protein n=1 Tax=Jatrophihabitans sp. TaxID=1932789 RepID=UPI003914B4E8
MVSDADPAALIAALRERLIGPDGEFQLAAEDVRGMQLPGFVHRRRGLRDWLVESASYGEREYLVQGDRRLTYAEHLAAVAALADVFAVDHGVQPGDRVAILAANSPDWVVAFWAAVSLGAVVVAGNAWWTAREAQYSLGRARPTVVVADGKHAELVESVDAPVLRMAQVPLLVGARGPVELRDVLPEQDSPAVVMYTSGTTGHPKGAVHSHRNLLAVIEYHRYTDAMAAQMAAAFGFPARSGARRYLMSLPLFHIASLHNLALPRLATGDTIVIDAGRFEVDRVLRLIERESITNWAIVPTMAHRIVSQGSLDGYDLSSLAALSINSAPSSPALKDRLRAAVPTVEAALADSYGLTEASTAATVATPMDLALEPTTVGRPIPGVEISIRSAGGAPLAHGEDGEIWLRSQYTMLGYWEEDPDATAVALTEDGWLRTGDLGRLQDGRLFMASRRSDLILRGGENVYPAEVEAVLDEHPAVRECAVFGVDDADLGQAVAAVVVCAGVAEDDLRQFVAERLAYYKVPSLWRLTDQPLTRTATGKVVRRTLSV